MQNFLLAVILALLIPGLVAASAIPDDVMKAARDSVKTTLKEVMPRDNPRALTRMGFHSADELDRAALGEGFEVFTIATEVMLDPANQDLKKMPRSTGEWLFVVCVDGEPRTVVTLAKLNGKWSAVAFGAALAKTLHAAAETWPESANYRLRLVRIDPPRLTFFELFHNDDLAAIIPGETVVAYRTSQFDPWNTVAPEEVLPVLRSAVKRQIENWKSLKDRFGGNFFFY